MRRYVKTFAAVLVGAALSMCLMVFKTTNINNPLKFHRLLTYFDDQNSTYWTANISRIILAGALGRKRLTPLNPVQANISKITLAADVGSKRLTPHNPVLANVSKVTLAADVGSKRLTPHNPVLANVSKVTLASDLGSKRLTPLNPAPVNISKITLPDMSGSKKLTAVAPTPNTSKVALGHDARMDNKSRALAGQSPLSVFSPSKAVICHTFSPGRFGNHLFEYASILGIAHTTNKTFYFSNDGEMRKVLKYPPVQTSDKDAMKKRCKAAKRINERWGGRYDSRLVQLQPGKDYYIGEYMQSWVYFDAIKDSIRKALIFNDEIRATARRVLDDIRKSFPSRRTLVGVHVRRGDLASNRHLISAGYLTAPPEFFKKALTYFRSRFENNVTFVILGEDRKWSMEHIPGVNNDTVFPVTSSPAVDMEILSQTDHMVRTVGTYGWWAAFKIAGRRPTVVYLKDFVKKKSGISGWYSENAEDYMLPGWLPM